MIALLKKDWRLFRVPVVGTLILIATPYVLQATILWLNPDYVALTYLAPHYLFATASAVGLVITVIMAAVFGGVAFASERRECWADFLAMLPVPRSRIVASKLTVVATFLGFISVILFSMCVVLQGSTDHWLYGVTLLASCMLMSFSVAWLGSSFLSSAAIAAGISIVLVTLALFWPVLAREVTLYDLDLIHFQIVTTACAGIVSLVAGTTYYLVRVEP
jgi:ABC-type transport system involved in multi-copper enzyme maturation permease subunit